MKKIHSAETIEKIRQANTFHGECSKRTKEYVAWCLMIQRCEDINWDHYADYGGRGITICKEWRESFECFLRDMGRAPSPKHSLDRIEVDGNYCKDNCRWALKKIQARNTRSNVYITHDGKTLALAGWAEELNINYKTFHGLVKYKKLSLIEIANKYSVKL